VVFTAAGSAVAQVRGLGDLASYLTIAFAVSVSALIGLLIMWRTRPSLADFGLRRPRNAAGALWWLPPVAVVVLVLLASGVTVPLAVVPGIVCLVVAVGLNEELFFRGIVFKALRRYGTGRAVLFSALIFGVMHLANVASGKTAGYLVLQVLFSMLFGIVTAELVAVTGSLWPGIVFHAAYDAVAYLGGDSNSTAAFASLAVQVAVLGAYALWLWRRLPREDVSA
jgi:membrane protease YdiL (CAAX protease family)